MMTFFALLLSLATPSGAPAASKSDGPTGWKCQIGRERLRHQESKEVWDKTKAIEEGKVNRDGLPKEARDILDQMTEHFEQSEDRYASDTAELMREFGGGRAARRTAC